MTGSLEQFCQAAMARINALLPSVSSEQYSVDRPEQLETVCCLTGEHRPMKHCKGAMVLSLLLVTLLLTLLLLPKWLCVLHAKCTEYSSVS